MKKNICQLHNLDEFNLLPEEPPMTTNRDHAFESQSNPSRPQIHQNLNNNNPVLPPAAATTIVPQKPEESLDTIRQAIEHDRLEDEYRRTIQLEATAATEREKEAAAAATIPAATAAAGDVDRNAKKSDVTQKSSH
uniref:Uncharacterized protein n=1 Tax=Panagrolaimus superbus TaxID=310955 RepID=A0A914YDF1_9BILA